MLFPGVNVLSDFTGENFIWINESSQLASLCKTWQAQAVIALDTEFIREKTFYPIIGLIEEYAPYRLALQAAIWNKDEFLQLMQPTPDLYHL